VSTDAIDIHIGQRIRQRRRELELSQGKVGKAYGVTFQQVGKHEDGSNRISASQLYKVAQTLYVPIGYFFEGLETP
jgi:transcriptional regulator with XRE-family HTH domain